MVFRVRKVLSYHRHNHPLIVPCALGWKVFAENLGILFPFLCSRITIEELEHAYTSFP